MNGTGVAVVGASMRSMFLFEYLQRHPQEGYISGVYDILPARGRYLLDRFANAEAVLYDSLEQAVSDPQASAVFVGTPDGEHVEPALAALQAGKHVYCEKPLAITLEDCDRIIARAEQSENIFYLGMNLRHSPVHEKVHELIVGDQLGKVLTIEANEYYYNGRTYFRRWNRLRRFGGGLWITKACHDFDLLNWLAGGRPKRVFANAALSYYRSRPEAGRNCRTCQLWETCPDCYQRNLPESPDWDRLAELTERVTGVPRDLCLFNAEKDTFDNGMAVIEYDNDVRACYVVNVVSGRSTRQIRVMGTKASVEGDMETGLVTLWPRHSHDKIIFDLSGRIKGTHGGADEGILRDFFHCCRTGSHPRSGGRDGRLSVQVGMAAQQSCDTGLPVVFDMDMTARSSVSQAQPSMVRV